MRAALVILISLAFFTPSVFAQDLSNIGPVALNLPINDSEAQVGDVISITKDGLKRTTVDADVAMYGVIVETPVISVRPKRENSRPVVTAGQVNVRVSTAGGNIKIGDNLTSSTTAGVAQKAKGGGYILGRALADFDSGEIGLIALEVNISYGQGSIDGSVPSFVALVTKGDNLRLILAVIVALITFIATSYTTIRLLSSGVTAIGRNPLAKRTIVGGMVLSSLFVGLIALGGLGIALAIINLGR